MRTPAARTGGRPGPWAADDGLALGCGRGRAGAGRSLCSAHLAAGRPPTTDAPEADLSLGGQVRLLAEFLERLELEEVTLVFNDWCGAQLLVAEGWDGRVGGGGAGGPGLLGDR
jgi:hypothetical protein